MARVTEQVGLASLAVGQQGGDAQDERLQRIARFSAAGAEAIRAAARFHPSTERGAPVLRMVDMTLDIVEEAVAQGREPQDALNAALVMLGMAAAGAGALDAAARGESVPEGRFSAFTGSDPPLDTFARGLLGVAQVCAELIESELAAL